MLIRLFIDYFRTGNLDNLHQISEVMPTIRSATAARVADYEEYGIKACMKAMIKAFSTCYITLPESDRCAMYNRVAAVLKSWKNKPNWKVVIDDDVFLDDDMLAPKFLSIVAECYPKDKDLNSKIFEFGIKSRCIQLVKCTRESATLEDSKALAYFKSTFGEMRYIMFQKMSPKMRNEIASMIQRENKSMYKKITSMAAFLTTKELLWVHKEAQLRDPTIAELVIAIQNGNLDLVQYILKETSCLNHVSKSSVLASLLKALCYNDKTPQWMEILIVIIKRTNKRPPQKPMLRGDECIQLLSTDFFAGEFDNLQKYTDWTTMKVDATQGYGIVCNFKLCQLLEKEGILKKWSESENIKFYPHPWMNVNKDSMRLLGLYNLM